MQLGAVPVVAYRCQHGSIFAGGLARARPFVHWDEGLRAEGKEIALLAADDIVRTRELGLIGGS